MAAVSAGILMFQRKDGEIRVLLAHPGGPFWRNKDLGAWSIPKGERDPGEAAEDAARREFAEELGVTPTGALLPLGEVRLKSGKRVEAFALEGDLDIGAIESNMFEIEWPPKSGQRVFFPEIDRAEWFPLGLAHEKIRPEQRPFLHRLAQIYADPP